MKRSKLYILMLTLLAIGIAACKNSEQQHSAQESEVYTCPMHPQIVRDKPGKCPICEMNLVKKKQRTSDTFNTSLGELTRPTDEFVVSDLPVVTLQQGSEQIHLNALGIIGYDNRQLGTVSSRIAGRIEKLYVRYRYQYIAKGQKVFDIYSPELLTSQENLIFLLKNDPSNQALISAARQRLLLLGMSAQQIAQLSKTGRPLFSVSVFSTYSGYVTEPRLNKNMATGINASMESNSANAVQTDLLTTTELPIKEGMYVEKGQRIFSVMNANKATVYLNIFSDELNLMKTGTQVMIVPETAPETQFRGTIDWIEPFYRPGSKTISARVYFNNANLKLPNGSQVQANISIGSYTAKWLPANAVVTTGLDNLVFKKEGNGFRPLKVTTGVNANDKIQIISGLSDTDSVVTNAQHLIGSESTIKIND